MTEGEKMNFFDLHCDTISECYNQKAVLRSNTLQLDLDRGKEIEKWVQVYAIWMDDVLRGEEAYNHYLKVYKYLKEQMIAYQDVIHLCKTSKQIEETLKEQNRVALLAIEGSSALGGKLERVKEFYDQGVRMMTLTWNGPCEVADGCMSENAGGLTPFGKQVVTKMIELGMLVDVSHLAERGFWDIVKLIKEPFIATHSNSKAICDVPRNLTDEQFSIFVERKGLVGMNFYPLFINGTLEAKAEELLPHIDHFLELGGEDVICMGSDFDGAKMPNDLRAIEDINYLYKLCTKRYGKEKTEKFFFDNAYKFITSKFK